MLNELVAMIVFPSKEEDERFFDIWVLLEFGVKESWTRLVRIGSFDPFKRRVRNLQVDGVKGSLQVFVYTQSSVSIEGGVVLGEERYNNP